MRIMTDGLKLTDFKSALNLRLWATKKTSHTTVERVITEKELLKMFSVQC